MLSNRYVFSPQSFHSTAVSGTPSSDMPVRTRFWMMTLRCWRTLVNFSERDFTFSHVEKTCGYRFWRKISPFATPGKRAKSSPSVPVDGATFPGRDSFGIHSLRPVLSVGPTLSLTCSSLHGHRTFSFRLLLLSSRRRVRDWEICQR